CLTLARLRHGRIRGRCHLRSQRHKIAGILFNLHSSNAQRYSPELTLDPERIKLQPCACFSTSARRPSAPFGRTSCAHFLLCLELPGAWARCCCWWGWAKVSVLDSTVK